MKRIIVAIALLFVFGSAYAETPKVHSKDLVPKIGFTDSTGSQRYLLWNTEAPQICSQKD